LDPGQGFHLTLQTTGISERALYFLHDVGQGHDGIGLRLQATIKGLNLLGQNLVFSVQLFGCFFRNTLSAFDRFTNFGFQFTLRIGNAFLLAHHLLQCFVH